MTNIFITLYDEETDTETTLLMEQNTNTSFRYSEKVSADLLIDHIITKSTISRFIEEPCTEPSFLVIDENTFELRLENKRVNYQSRICGITIQICTSKDERDTKVIDFIEALISIIDAKSIRYNSCDYIGELRLFNEKTPRITKHTSKLFYYQTSNTVVSYFDDKTVWLEIDWLKEVFAKNDDYSLYHFSSSLENYDNKYIFKVSDIYASMLVKPPIPAMKVVDPDITTSSILLYPRINIEDENNAAAYLLDMAKIIAIFR